MLGPSCSQVHSQDLTAPGRECSEGQRGRLTFRRALGRRGMGFTPSSQAGTCLALCYQHRLGSRSPHYHTGQAASLLSTSASPPVRWGSKCLTPRTVRVQETIRGKRLAQSLTSSKCSVLRNSVATVAAAAVVVTINSPGRQRLLGPRGRAEALRGVVTYVGS